MLYSILVGFIAYYGVLFAISVLVNAMAIEGDLITLAVIGFIGAYLARNNRFVNRLAMWVGIIPSIVLVAIWVFLPMLAGTTDKWLVILAIAVGLVMYIATRPRLFQRYNRIRPDGTRTAPPFGMEWCRWLFIFMM